jgi:hypothetical protein
MNPNQATGRRSCKAWPPSSPDLTPQEFFFWNYIKQVVHVAKINDVHNLKQRIRDAAESVIPDVLTCVTNRTHIEFHD